MGKTVRNPFEDDIVYDFREIGKSVPSLNSEVLEELVRQFGRLEEGPTPRSGRRLSHAQFLLSPHAGYGKSHLTGRLREELGRRAVFVYVRPFEDASVCWQSLLQQTLRVLDTPENHASERRNPPTALECLAHKMFSLLAEGLIRKGKIPLGRREGVGDALRRISGEFGFRGKWLDRLAPKLNRMASDLLPPSESPWTDENHALRFLRDSGISKLRADRRWANWIESRADLLASELRRHCRLNASLSGWVRVLFAYSFRFRDFRLREICLDWLGGKNLDPEDAKRIGIKSQAIPSGQSARVCKSRLTDLCRLAGFHRPFVFCFDQTEYYGKAPMLAREFGLVVEALSAEGCNQMTLITANQSPWANRISPHWEDASLDRLSPFRLELKEIDREQAAELIRQRLPDGDPRMSDFQNDKWLASVFRNGNPRVRNFIRECAKRWRRLEGAASSAHTGPSAIATFYEQYAEKAEQRNEEAFFDEDLFHWLLNEAARGIEMEPLDHERFPLCWKPENRKIVFGFENGSHWGTWKKIAKEGQAFYDADPTTKIVFFRPESDKIPGPKWKETTAAPVNAAKRKYLDIVYLENAAIRELLSLREFRIASGEGEVHFAEEDIAAFVRKKLEPFRKRILMSPPADDVPIRSI